MTAQQYENFSQTLEWLIGSDGKMELFEFVLQKIVLRNLAPKFGQARPPRRCSFTRSSRSCRIAPSCCPRWPTSAAATPREIQKAFDTGAPYLRAPDDAGLALLPREQCGVDQIDAALNRLALAVPIIKKNLLEACAHVVGADGVIQEAEAELLRAVADTLDCPMPPFVRGGVGRLLLRPRRLICWRLWPPTTS